MNLDNMKKIILEAIKKAEMGKNESTNYKSE